MALSVPRSSLKKWALKIFQDATPTIELMASTHNEQDKRAIAIIALMAVKPTDRYAGMSIAEADYISSCHKYLNSLLPKTNALH